MNYTIRPAGPEDTAGITALRRMPGVFEQAASLPSDLTVESNLRRRHSGGLGIMVRTDCQGQGIGTALLEAVLDLADNWLMLRRVELEVYADNQRAVRLYEKFGFEAEGRKREAAVKNGTYVDLRVMARLRTP